MPKKLDLYIIKTFLGPFFFIFSILFFIFIVNVVWIQISNLGGKGLSTWELIKFFYYISVGVVKMVLPLTILLASIMTFGGFGERYELAAMKSAGMSLWRVMRPLFFTSIFFAIILFVFSNYVIPDFQRKSKNMLFNIISSKPALNFTPGQFIESIPGMAIKFDKIYGENDEFIEGVFIHKTANFFEDQRTIVAQKGKFISEKNSNYLKLILYNGYVIEDKIGKTNIQERQKQENQTIKFDTLVSHIDISEILDQAIESEKIVDSYEFHTFLKLFSTIDEIAKNQQENHRNIVGELINHSSNYINHLDKVTQENKTIKEPFDLDKLEKEKKSMVLKNAYEKIEQLQTLKNERNDAILNSTKVYAKAVMYQQQIIAYSVMSIIFFLVGASLGSIVRKGGVGLPVVLAIIIFVIFFIINLTAENLAWKGEMNAYLAAWLPNIVFMPVSIWLTVNALRDSQLFDIEKYKALVMPIVKRFSKKQEHKRYQ